MLKRHLARGLLGSSWALAFSCTLGGLADYELERCELAAGDTRQQDPCSRLSSSEVDACHVFSCDTATGQCVLGPLDADRDGQTALECGGKDCDDARANVGPDSPERCDASAPYRDDNCDGKIDENSVAFATKGDDFPTRSPSDVRFDVVEGRVLASFVQKLPIGQCIQGLNVNGPIRDGCAFAATSEDRGFLPRQPSLSAVGVSGFGVAYVEAGAGCAAGALAYRVFDQTGIFSFDRLPCRAGVSLPSLLATADGLGALIVYVEAPLATHDDALDDCRSVQAAKLQVVRVTRAASNDAKLEAAWARPLSERSTLTRSPAMLRLADGRLLIAAPAEGGAAAWLLQDAALEPSQPLAIAGFEEARAVSVGARSLGRGARLAFVGEIGCAPQSLKLVLAQLDEGSQSLRFEGAALDLLPAGSRLSSDAKVSWLEQRGEWLVTWLSEGPKVLGLRVSDEGQPIGAPFTLLEGAQAGAAAPDASVLGFEGTSAQGRFLQGAVGCL